MFEPTIDPGSALPGDDLVQDARKQITRSIVIDATPEAIWPSLREMARLDGDHGTAILRSEAPRVLLLGALYDHDAVRYLPFDADRPATYWHATWVLVLTAIDGARTRLDVRSRVAFTGDAVGWASIWTHPFHDFMAPDQLRGVKARAEGRLPGPRGPLGRLLDLARPLIRRVRRRGGASPRPAPYRSDAR